MFISRNYSFHSNRHYTITPAISIATIPSLFKPIQEQPIDVEYPFLLNQSLVDELGLNNPDKGRVTELYLKLGDIKSSLNEFTHLKVLSFFLLQTNLWKLDPIEITDRLSNESQNSESTLILLKILDDIRIHSKYSTETFISLAIDLINRNTFKNYTSKDSIHVLVTLENQCKLQNNTQSLSILNTLSKSLLFEQAQTIFLTNTLDRFPNLAINYVNQNESIHTLSILFHGLCLLNRSIHSTTLTSQIESTYERLLHYKAFELDLPTSLLLLQTKLYKQLIMKTLTKRLLNASSGLLNLLISELTRNDQLAFGLSVVNQIVRYGYVLDCGTMKRLIQTCGERGLKFNGAHLILCAMDKPFWEELSGVCIGFYLNVGQYENALKLFGEFQEKRKNIDTCVYGLFIKYFNKRGEYGKGIEWLERVLMHGMSVDGNSVKFGLKSCIAQKNYQKAALLMELMSENHYIENETSLRELVESVILDGSELYSNVIIQAYSKRFKLSPQIMVSRIESALKNRDGVMIQSIMVVFPEKLPELLLNQIIYLFKSQKSRFGIAILIQHSIHHNYTHTIETINTILSSVIESGCQNPENLSRFIKSLQYIEKEAIIVNLVTCIGYHLKDIGLVSHILESLVVSKVSNSDFEKVYMLLIVCGGSQIAHGLLHRYLDAKRITVYQYSVYLNWIGGNKRKSK